jgi:hypothetical protein
MGRRWPSRRRSSYLRPGRFRGLCHFGSGQYASPIQAQGGSAARPWFWHYFGTNETLTGANQAPRLWPDRVRNCRSAAYGGSESG